MRGVEEEPGLVPAPVVTLGEPRFLPGTAFSGLGIFGSKALFCFGGGGGFLLGFSSVLKSGTFFRSGGTISSFLGCGGSGLMSFFQRLLDGSTTLLSFTDGGFGMGTPAFPGTSATLVPSFPPPWPAQRVPFQS